jgi:subtilisin family serine protease
MKPSPGATLPGFIGVRTRLVPGLVGILLVAGGVSGSAAASRPAGRSPRPASSSETAGERGLGAAMEPGLYWIRWGPGWEEGAAEAAVAGERAVSPRAEARLRKAGAAPAVTDPGNRPVPRAFLDHLRGLGIEVRVASRSLRAASARLDATDLARLATSPGIAGLVPVATLRRPTGEIRAPWGGEGPAAGSESAGSAAVDLDARHSALPAKEPTAADTLPDPRSLTRADYGASWRQCEQLGVPSLHRLGYSGRGVLVCVLDGGFSSGHETFARAHLVAMRDFVEHDRSVGYDPSRPGAVYNTRLMEFHGTYTFSALGGYTPGRLIGPAYGAEFALGRTEVVESETRMEEDTYVAGLEWADSLGADVVSTSLGYLDFLSEGFFYPPASLDGRHAVTSLAAAWLARRGVVLVTAMGNDGPMPATLLTPADAESVVSVGAVDSRGGLAEFSARGPNARGVIKPDVCAPGVATACADASARSAYTSASGTSLATPLIAGLVALLLEAHPDWTPWQVQEALHRAGDQAQSPDNERGWGVPDGPAALRAFAPIGAGSSDLSLRSTPNPLAGSGELTLDLGQPEPGPVSVTVLDAAGRVVARPFVDAPMQLRVRLRWTPGANLASGVYYLRIETTRGVLRGRFVLTR